MLTWLLITSQGRRTDRFTGFKEPAEASLKRLITVEYNFFPEINWREPIL
jgi:hypothetical protein